MKPRARHIVPCPGNASRGGQATVEFALVLVVLASVLYGILEISRLMFINAELENAAREAAHYASRHPGTSSSYLRANVIGPRLTLIDRNSPDFYVSDPAFPNGGIGPYYPVQVTVAFTWTSMVNIMPDASNLTFRPLGPVALRASATRLIEGR